MSSELGAVVVLVVVHLLAIGVIAVMLVGDVASVRGWWPTDGFGDDPEPREPETPRGGAGVPLPDAAPARRRLRGPGPPIAAPRPRRRSSPAPDRERSPA